MLKNRVSQLVTLARAGSNIGGYLVKGMATQPWIRDELAKRQRGADQTHLTSQQLLHTFNVNVTTRGEIPEDSQLVVSNHMSYLDIPLLSSQKPYLFVTSSEVQHTPFLGRLAKLGGSYFVDRRKKSRLREEITELATLLTKGCDVAFFPEGTSTDGSGILPFKQALFQSAVLARKDVLPVCLKYETVDGELFSPENCDNLCWYGDMSFFPHFVKLAGIEEATASVTYLPPIRFQEGISARDFARQAESAIRSEYSSEAD